MVQPGSVQFVTLDGTHSGTIQNISVSGMRIRTDSHLRPEDSIVVKFPSDHNLVIQGIVVWASSKIGAPKEAAIRFGDLPEDKKRALQQYIDHLEESKKAPRI